MVNLSKFALCLEELSGKQYLFTQTFEPRTEFLAELCSLGIETHKPVF